MPTTNFASIRRRLIRWYDTQRRDLPWRRTRDPYAIWVAETMLQQTQVKTVAPYYERFLSAFPTVHALDRAPLGKVLALWSGLGYYRRVESLKKAARRLVRDRGGKIPADFAALRALPGVGPYTAGALMSIAFDRRFPALDGNARRVLGRLFHQPKAKDLQAIAARLIPPSKPGRFNQALMELGATICIARAPRCPQCPVARACGARKMGIAASAAPQPQRRTESIDWPLAILQNRGKILLRRRSRGDILGGLWEVPGGERKKGERMKTALMRHLRELSLPLGSGARIGEIRHSITYRRIRCPVFLFALPRVATIILSGPNRRWFSPAVLSRQPVSAMTLKAVKCFAAHEKNLL